MKVLFCAEIIGTPLTPDERRFAGVLGDAPAEKARPWVAEITGLSSKYGYERRFVRGREDWRKANSKGTRGVWIWWSLEPGTYYQARYRTSWKNASTVFLKVDEQQAKVVEAEQEEVDRWLRELLNIDRIG